MKRPAGAKVIVSTPEILTININVTGLVGTGTEEAFKKLLAEYFRKHGFKLTKVSQADIVKQLFNAGYTDYNSIQINSTNGSVALNGKLPKIGTVVFNG